MTKLQYNSIILIIGENSSIVNKLLDQLPDTKNGKIIKQSDNVAEILKEHVKQQKERLNGSDSTPSYIVLDNCIDPKSREFWKLLNILITNKKVLHNSVIIVCRQPNNILELSSDIDYTFMFKEDDKHLRQLRHKYFSTNQLTDFEAFDAVHQQIIDDSSNNCLIFDYTQPPLNCIKWYSFF